MADVASLEKFKKIRKAVAGAQLLEKTHTETLFTSQLPIHIFYISDLAILEFLFHKLAGFRDEPFVNLPFHGERFGKQLVYLGLANQNGCHSLRLTDLFWVAQEKWARNEKWLESLIVPED